MTSTAPRSPLGGRGDRLGQGRHSGEHDQRRVRRSSVAVRFTESAEFRRTSAPYLRVIDLSLSMLGRAPSSDELADIVAALDSGEITITDLIFEYRHSDEFADRFPAPPG